MSKPPRARLVRRLALLVFAVAALEVPWLITLGFTLRGQVHVRMWATAWIGLDCAQIVGLVALGILMLRRHAAVMPVAACTGTLFVVDAWFDIMLSPTATDLWVAVGSALLIELPIAVLCTVVAWQASRRAQQRLTRERLMRARRSPEAPEPADARDPRGA